MTTITPERLRKLGTFAALGQPLLRRLAASMRHQHCPAGATVFAQHDEARDVLIVLRGHLRITAYSRAGREVVFHDRFAGDMVGELSAIDGAPRGGNLVAVSEAEFGCIEAGVFNQLLREEPAFALCVIGRLTRLVRSLNRRIQLLAAPVPTRVCGELLRLAERQRIGDNAAQLVPPPKHLDIANRINTHREAVSRTLGDLQRQAIIHRGQGELLVRDLEALRAHAEGRPLPTARAGARAAPGTLRSAPAQKR
jgi:CRP/FNR family transcriptional regulator, cyclic AMP receptor protein